MSWSIARARRSGLIRRTGCWSRWGIRGRIARRGGRSRRRSAGGGTSTAGGHGRGSRSRGCGCSGITATGLRSPGSRAVLFCAWLAWSRFRVVVPLRDKTLASVVIGLDRTLRLVGAVPTYALTDNEKTVTVEHVCGIAVRNATIVEVSRHYGLTIATCEPADPQSKGGSEATVQDREGGSGPDRSQPPRRVRGLAGAGAGVPGVHGRCQHAPAPRDASAAGVPARAGA